MFAALSVFLRKFFVPIPDSDHLLALGMVVLVFFSLPYCWVQKETTSMDFVVKYLRLRLQRGSEALGAALGMIVFGYLIPSTLKMGIRGLRAGYVTENLLINIFPFRICLVIGSTLFCLVMLLSLIRSICHIVRGT